MQRQLRLELLRRRHRPVCMCSHRCASHSLCYCCKVSASCCTYQSAHGLGNQISRVLCACSCSKTSPLLTCHTNNRMWCRGGRPCSRARRRQRHGRQCCWRPAQSPCSLHRVLQQHWRRLRLHQGPGRTRAPGALGVVRRISSTLAAAAQTPALGSSAPRPLPRRTRQGRSAQQQSRRLRRAATGQLPAPGQSLALRRRSRLAATPRTRS